MDRPWRRPWRCLQPLYFFVPWLLSFEFTFHTLFWFHFLNGRNWFTDQQLAAGRVSNSLSLFTFYSLFLFWMSQLHEFFSASREPSAAEMVSITTPGEEELHFRNSELDWMVPWTRSWMMMEAGRLPEYSSAPGGSSISAAMENSER